jgi:TP901 family phage tail tape measure protein
MYNLVVKGVKKALSEAIQTVKELDKYLTEQAMVTGKTRKETYDLIGSYQDLAMQCGATTKEIAQVATEYMKQGKSTADALVLTEAAVKAAKVAGVSVGDSVNYLTTALNGFQLAAEDAMKVSDKFAAVAASSATDYDELAIALSKVASQANLAGMSIDYTTALLTKGLETTREAPETMGTALKTIIARMRELGDYGETLDDGMDINNVESQLKYVGIALRDSNGELRSTEDVLDELGQKWDTLDKNQQAAVAKALAGTRQQARLIAMMEDYERVTELQEISQRSAGATAAQAAVYMEGMEGALNRVQVAWEKVVMTFTDSEVIIGVIDGISKFLDYIGEMLESPVFTSGVVAMILMTVTKTVGMKLQEQHIAREIAKLENDQNIKNSKAQEIAIQNEIENIKTKKLEYQVEKENLKLQVDKNKLVKKELLQAKQLAIIDKEGITDSEKEKEINNIQKEIDVLDEEANKEKALIDARESSFDDEIARKEEQLGMQQRVTESLEAQGNALLQNRQA